LFAATDKNLKELAKLTHAPAEAPPNFASLKAGAESHRHLWSLGFFGASKTSSRSRSVVVDILIGESGRSAVYLTRAPMRPEKPDELVFELAESLNPIDEHTMEVKLRKGVKFHNGEPFTAADVKATYEYGYMHDRPAQWYPGPVKIDVIDDYTCHINTKDFGYPAGADRTPCPRPARPAWPVARARVHGYDRVARDAAASCFARERGISLI
jgi:ABC-type transport system substrate-binding protein